MPRKRRTPSKKKLPNLRALTRAEAREYLARYELVNERIAAERRAKTPTQRFRELCQLMQWAKAFGWRDAPHDDDQQIWARWNKLREAARG